MTTTDFNKKHPVYPEQSSILGEIDSKTDNIESFIKKAASAILFVFLLNSIMLAIVVSYCIFDNWKGN